MILQQNQSVFVLKMYKPGFPEMDNIFLNSFVELLFKNLICIIIFLQKKHAKKYLLNYYLPFWQ
jgi:hypothetical protein